MILVNLDDGLITHRLLHAFPLPHPMQFVIRAKLVHTDRKQAQDHDHATITKLKPQLISLMRVDGSMEDGSIQFMIDLFSCELLRWRGWGQGF